MSEDEKIREQLKNMIAFVESTPAYWPGWWSGDFPAYPDVYTPEDWQGANIPVWKAWEIYLRDAKQEKRKEINAHLSKADELDIALLLEVSKKATKARMIANRHGRR